MCLLFLLVGDGDQVPTIVCNNRDEYFERKTLRGKFHEGSNSFYPTDAEQSGSWLFFQGLGEPSDKFRYGLVLNFHRWRNVDYSKEFAIGDNDIDAAKLQSRGLLIKDFQTRTDVTAADYAQEVFARRHDYRPFNLIVGDKDGSYYVSSSAKQSAPVRLEKGYLYGISNGYIEDHWEKVKVGLDNIEMVLQTLPESLSETRADTRSDSATEGHTKAQSETPASETPASETVASSASVSKAAVASASTGPQDLKYYTRTTPALRVNASEYPQLAERLLRVMKDQTPLRDYSFGTKFTTPMQLSAVFVKPTINTYRLSANWVTAKMPLLNDNLTKLALRGLYQPQSKLLFGTRTVTVLVAYGAARLQARPQTAPLTASQTTVNGPVGGPVTASIAASSSGSATDERQTNSLSDGLHPFSLLEHDLDTSCQTWTKWSTNYFTNTKKQ